MRVFIGRKELGRIFGGTVSVGKHGVFVTDGGNGLLRWRGDDIGVPVDEEKRKEALEAYKENEENERKENDV